MNMQDAPNEGLATTSRHRHLHRLQIKVAQTRKLKRSNSAGFAPLFFQLFWYTRSASRPIFFAAVDSPAVEWESEALVVWQQRRTATALSPGTDGCRRAPISNGL
ncbi:MAG: hypothetical protein Q8M31_17380 [Beijerinckiaceae bacterium]|nr:hypothetical protein [Beijerinckiaceae bacterium]